MEQPLNQMPSSEKRLNDMVSILAGDDVDTSEYQKEDAANKPALTSPERVPQATGGDELHEASKPEPQYRRAEDRQPKELSQVTHDHVASAAKELTEAMQQVQWMYDNNQLSPEQYQQACQNAQSMIPHIEKMDLAAKANELNQHQHRARQYEELCTLIPEVATKEGREQTKDRVLNFIAKHGFTQKELDAIATPRVIKFLNDVAKATAPRQNVSKIPVKKHERQFDNRPLSVNRGKGTDIDEIANILMKSGIK